MPEGDTIHRLAARFEAELVGTELRDVRLEGQRATSLIGRAFDRAYSHGKHLFLAAGDVAVRTHLGMHGRWRTEDLAASDPPGARGASCELRTAARRWVCTRAREVELVDLRGQRHRRFLQRLGEDLLAPEFDVDRAVSRARALLPADAPVADVLLDQRVAAGIGNVFKSELLFAARLHPLTPQSAAEDRALAAIFEAARESLRVNAGRRIRRTRPARRGDLDDGGKWVDHRSGRPCLRCGAPIAFARLGRHARASWWCPTCQPEP